MLRVALGPSSQKTVTDSLMAASAQLARQHPRVRLHTHLAENQVGAGRVAWSAAPLWGGGRVVRARGCNVLAWLKLSACIWCSSPWGGWPFWGRASVVTPRFVVGSGAEGTHDVTNLLMHPT